MDSEGRPPAASGENSLVAGDKSTRQATSFVPGSTAMAAVTPQIVAVIEEAVATFFGRKVRILAVRVGCEPLPASKGSWTGQGREIIHGSHNLIQRGR